MLAHHYSIFAGEMLFLNVQQRHAPGSCINIIYTHQLLKPSCKITASEAYALTGKLPPRLVHQLASQLKFTAHETMPSIKWGQIT